MVKVAASPRITGFMKLMQTSSRVVKGARREYAPRDKFCKVSSWNEQKQTNGEDSRPLPCPTFKWRSAANSLRLASGQLGSHYFPTSPLDDIFRQCSETPTIVSP